jgi:hypothetical protein
MVSPIFIPQLSLALGHLDCVEFCATPLQEAQVSHTQQEKHKDIKEEFGRQPASSNIDVGEDALEGSDARPW